ncbi:MAG: hypothetical protein HC894_24630 [Microcoleus sp. SM1_3_4]|nr:hypothetical protein [Microcoleus sp. SM1_3_4]
MILFPFLLPAARSTSIALGLALAIPGGARSRCGMRAAADSCQITAHSRK